MNWLFAILKLYITCCARYSKYQKTSKKHIETHWNTWYNRMNSFDKAPKRKRIQLDPIQLIDLPPLELDTSLIPKRMRPTLSPIVLQEQRRDNIDENNINNEPLNLQIIDLKTRKVVRKAEKIETAKKEEKKPLQETKVEEKKETKPLFDKKILKTLYFNQDSKIRAMWDLYIMLICTYNVVVIPLRIASFNYNVADWIAPDLFADMILWIDILFNFRTSNSAYGYTPTLTKDMAKQYFSTFFLFDIIAILPLDIVGYCWNYYPCWRIIRLLRLVRLNYYINAMVILFKKGIIFAKVIETSFLTLLAGHFSACAYIWVVLYQPSVVSSYMVSGVDITQVTPWRRYLRAFYWGLSMFSGYANTQPGTNWEYGITLLVAIFGLAIYGYIIGTITELIRTDDLSVAEFNQKMETIQAFMEYRDLPTKLRNDILSYYTYVFTTRKSLNENEILEELPLYLRTEMALFLNKSIIEKVPFFSKLEPQFIESIVLKLKPLVALPHSFVIKKGDIGREMFFISRGSVEVVSDPDEKGNRTVFATLNEGSFFGEVALLNNTKRGAFIRAKDFCDLFVFTKADFEEALRSFPENVKKQILDIANQRNAAQKK